MDYSAIDPADIGRLMRKARAAGDAQAVAMLTARKAYVVRRNAAQLEHMRDASASAAVFAMTVEQRNAMWESLGLPFAGLDA